jgi:hypothetical protein
MTYQGKREAEVRANAEGFLEGPVRAIWPGAYDADGQFRWEVLKADESEGPEPEGKARFADAVLAGQRLIRPTAM